MPKNSSQSGFMTILVVMVLLGALTLYVGAKNLGTLVHQKNDVLGVTYEGNLDSSQDNFITANLKLISGKLYSIFR